MQIILTILVLSVAAEHIFIMLLEMFFIKSSIAKRTFNLSNELIDKKEVGVMFANQGLYNGFLAAGLLWSFFVPNEMAVDLRFFFLGCVIIAATYGSLTSNKKIIIKQGSLAILAMGTLVASM
jgi:putative membrane protein